MCGGGGERGADDALWQLERLVSPVIGCPKKIHLHFQRDHKFTNWFSRVSFVGLELLVPLLWLLAVTRGKCFHIFSFSDPVSLTLSVWRLASCACRCPVPISDQVWRFLFLCPLHHDGKSELLRKRVEPARAEVYDSIWPVKMSMWKYLKL